MTAVTADRPYHVQFCPTCANDGRVTTATVVSSSATQLTFACDGGDGGQQHQVTLDKADIDRAVQALHLPPYADSGSTSGWIQLELAVVVPASLEATQATLRDLESQHQAQPFVLDHHIVRSVDVSEDEQLVEYNARERLTMLGIPFVIPLECWQRTRKSNPNEVYGGAKAPLSVQVHTHFVMSDVTPPGATQPRTRIVEHLWLLPSVFFRSYTINNARIAHSHLLTEMGKRCVEATGAVATG